MPGANNKTEAGSEAAETESKDPEVPEVKDPEVNKKPVAGPPPDPAAPQSPSSTMPPELLEEWPPEVMEDIQKFLALGDALFGAKKEEAGWYEGEEGGEEEVRVPRSPAEERAEPEVRPEAGANERDAQEQEAI